MRNPSFREGFHAGIPFAIASFILSTTFGVLAHPVMGAIAPIVMSTIVYAGSAQFGALAVLAAGGGPIAAVLAGTLLNMRYLPMGIALGPSIEGSAWKRFLVGQGMIDFSWAGAAREGGRFDWRFMLGATAPAYPLWVAGTAVGVLAGDLIGDPDRLGLDAIFPAFFLALLLSGEVSAGRRAVVAALLGGAVALALVPFAPAGIPVIAACIGALIGLDEAGRRGAAGEPEELEELEELGELEA
ncbi:MAG: AzlC family ABC transporter permease [Thermoleophilales bacterium]|nr:AzlC family ABC transporter permease [Thermoleophilales bacterium]